MERAKPKVVISRCLGFEPCRYNGQMYKEEFIEKMGAHIEFITICPEMDIGMSVPRESIRLINEKGKIMLLQQKTEKDYLNKMQSYINMKLSDFGDVDGFILKSKSPSCGIRDAKIYQGRNKSSSSKKGSGIFGGAILEAYGNFPVEDDGRLKNFRIREHFLTRLFILKAFKQVEKSSSLEELISFHANNTLLFMSFNQKEYRELNKLIKEYSDGEREKLLGEYEKHLVLLLERTRRITSNVKVLKYMLDILSERLSVKEKMFISETIESYRDNKLPLSVPCYLIRLNLIRFDESDLANQTYFNPYPEELIELGDSGKGRDF